MWLAAQGTIRSVQCKFGRRLVAPFLPLRLGEHGGAVRIELRFPTWHSRDAALARSGSTPHEKFVLVSVISVCFHGSYLA